MTEPTDKPFEQALSELEAVVRRLEEGQLPLAEALAAYEAGVGLVRACQGQLERAEQRVRRLAGVDAAGLPILEPFPAAENAP